MKGFRWPDPRDWIGIGTFSLTVFILVLIWRVPELRDNEFFKNIAILIIGTGWVNGAVAWAYSATKSGGELANQAAKKAMNGGGSGGPTLNTENATVNTENATVNTENATVEQTVTQDGDEANRTGV